MKINELIKAPLIPFSQDVTTFMKKYGFVRIGSGRYSTVFNHPNLNYVLKVFNNNDKGYIAFVKYALQNPSPYLPKFRGKLVKINNKYSATRMEILSRNDLVNPIIRLLEYYLDDYMKYLEDNYQYNYSFKEGYLEDRKINIENKFQGLTKILEILAQIAVKLGLDTGDLGPSNTMMRGSQLVITDPL